SPRECGSRCSRAACSTPNRSPWTASSACSAHSTSTPAASGSISRSRWRSTTGTSPPIFGVSSSPTWTGRKCLTWLPVRAAPVLSGSPRTPPASPARCCDCSAAPAPTEQGAARAVPFSPRPWGGGGWGWERWGGGGRRRGEEGRGGEKGTAAAVAIRLADDGHQLHVGDPLGQVRLHEVHLSLRQVLGRLQLGGRGGGGLLDCLLCLDQ